MKLILIILLTGHILGDYYVQTERMAELKEKDGKVLRMHCLTYGLPFLFSWFLFGLDLGLLGVFAAAVLLHGVIDLGKAQLVQKLKHKLELETRRDAGIYVLDQGIHWLLLFVTAYLFREVASDIAPFGFLAGILKELGIPWHRPLQWILALVLIYRPSNITFQKLFSIYKPQPELEDDLMPTISGTRQEKLKAGGIIGGLEKFISLIFLASGDRKSVV